MAKNEGKELFLDDVLENLSSTEKDAVLEKISSARHMLPKYGRVQDLEDNEKTIPWRFDKVNESLQLDVVDYVDNPPRDSLGRSLWMTVLSSRQSTKSSIASAAGYPRLATIEGWEHYTIVDKKKRAENLLRTLLTVHDHWPTMGRHKTTVDFQSRQLAFKSRAKAQIFAEDDGKNIGIGARPSYLHMSECGFYKDFSGIMSPLYPALRPRKNVRVIWECTPSPLPMGADWQDHYLMATQRIGRHFAAFYPFYWSQGNVDLWDKSWKLDNEEIRLLDKFGKYGLEEKHLAFRRISLQEDRELRKRPELFGVWYPFDDITCWLTLNNSVIPSRVLDLLMDKVTGELMMFDPPYIEYKQPRADAIYVIGADPTGQKSNDNAAFVVIECWKGHWELVARYSAHVDNLEFADFLYDTGIKYNNALVVIERMGVGEFPIGHLRHRDYPNLYKHKDGHYGFPFSSNKVAIIGDMVDDLLENFYIYDKQLIMQLKSYQNDKHRQRTFRSELVALNVQKGSRDKHHWDSVSALMMASQGCRKVPQKTAPWIQDIKPNKAQFPQYFMTVEQSRERMLQNKKSAKIRAAMEEKQSRNGRIARVPKLRMRK